MYIEQANKLNQLLQNWHPGTLLFSTWLNKNGYSAQLMQQYRKSGWFSLLSKGVLYRTGDKFSAYAALTGQVFWALPAINSKPSQIFILQRQGYLNVIAWSKYQPEIRAAKDSRREKSDIS